MGHEKNLIGATEVLVLLEKELGDLHFAIQASMGVMR